MAPMLSRYGSDQASSAGEHNLRLTMAKSCMQAFKAAMAAGLQYKRAPKDDFYSEVVDLLGETG